MRNNSKKGLFFYGMGRLSWHSKGKDWRDLGLQWGPALCPPELPEFGKERGDLAGAVGDPCWIPTAGSGWVCWLCAGRGLGVTSSPQLSGESLGALRATAARLNFSMVSLCCLSASMSIYMHKRTFPFPLTGRQNCTRLKPAHWLKWQLSKVIWVFFLFSQNYWVLSQNTLEIFSYLNIPMELEFS